MISTKILKNMSLFYVHFAGDGDDDGDDQDDDMDVDDLTNQL